MSPVLTVILLAIAFVGLFVLGMSLTLIFKGHNIESEISTNRHMQERGIKCAVQQTREDMAEADCKDVGCHGNCSACDIEGDPLRHKRH